MTKLIEQSDQYSVCIVRTLKHTKRVKTPERGSEFGYDCLNQFQEPSLCMGLHNSFRYISTLYNEWPLQIHLINVKVHSFFFKIKQQRRFPISSRNYNPKALQCVKNTALTKDMNTICRNLCITSFKSLGTFSIICV